MIIFLFTGPSAAGKSTIAESLAHNFNLPIIRERAILKELAAARGYKRTREWLADKGIQEVLDCAMERTLEVIATHLSRQCVLIDGSYDARLLDQLPKRFPDSELIIICTNAPEDVRGERMAQRLNSTIEEAIKERDLIDWFKNKAGMEIIVQKAHVTIENTKPIEEVIREASVLVEQELGSYHVGVEREG